MKATNKQLEWAYMAKVLSQGPQYLAYAIGIFVIALATASGVLEKPIPTHTAAKSATVPMVASAANYFPATKLASVAKP